MKGARQFAFGSDDELIAMASPSARKALAHLPMQKVVRTPLAGLQQSVETRTFCVVAIYTLVNGLAHFLFTASRNAWMSLFTAQCPTKDDLPAIVEDVCLKLVAT